MLIDVLALALVNSMKFLAKEGNISFWIYLMIFLRHKKFVAQFVMSGWIQPF